MTPLKLNISYKHHLLVAVIIALWLVLFLVLIAPFDIAELPFAIRFEIMPLYGLISFISYVVLLPIQNFIFKKLGKWTLFLEILIIILFNVIVLIGSYFYYKSDIINGEYSFVKFTFEVYYPIFLIILPILLFTRWYLSKKAVAQNSDKIVLTGENKLDVLQIHLSDLVCISSADNYVEVSYLMQTKLSKKLLRTTLKNIHPQVPDLLKVHRSHLINPVHFKDWKNANTVELTQTEVPVSKNYRKKVLAIHDHSSQKPNDSSQTL